MACASTTSLSNEKKGFVVIGLCLNDVLTPTLRDVLATKIPTWHQDLCKRYGIDKQVLGTKIQFWKNGKYENINYNHELESKSDWDYGVTDAVSLAKLFVEPFMPMFTSFDEMDLSLILSVIGKAPLFTKAADAADKVRNDVRNKWAHCINLEDWTEEKIEAAFASMKALLEILNLSCDELNNWKNKAKGNEIANYSYYHSLYSFLNFDWLIYLQITGANTSLSMRTLKMVRQLKLNKTPAQAYTLAL